MLFDCPRICLQNLQLCGYIPRLFDLLLTFRKLIAIEILTNEYQSRVTVFTFYEK